MNIMLIGPQGSGKGTQGDMLVPRFNLMKISTGDLFRAEISSGSELGESVRGFLDRGELVPDDVTLSVVERRLEQIDEGDVDGAVFDGFPRTLTQAVGLDQLLNQRGSQIDHVFEISVPDDVLIERLAGRRVCPECGSVYHVQFQPPAIEGTCDSCGHQIEQRSDDTAESIQRRLDLYHEQTFPLLEYYRPRGIVQSVDGSQAIDQVGQALDSAIAEPVQK